MRTLPDYFESDLTLLSIGLNPSLVSVRAGFYFANPRNRFWRALNASGLLQQPLEPGKDSHEVLLQRYRIGFTDVVKRPTASAKALSTQDFRKWVPVLMERIHQYQPQFCWFHGKIALANTLLHAGMNVRAGEWGLQQYRLAEAQVYMSPNPSSANAVFRLADLVQSYDQLARLLK